MSDAFGKRVASPWEELQGGLALGDAAFQKRVESLLRKKGGREELKWVARAERGNKRSVAARDLAARQPERSWQVWIKVHLGVERRIDMAPASVYMDGNAITQMLKRPQREARINPAATERGLRLETEINHILSRVNGLLPERAFLVASGRLT